MYIQNKRTFQSIIAYPLVYEVSKVLMKHWNAYSVSAEGFPEIGRLKQNKPLDTEVLSACHQNISFDYDLPKRLLDA